jgi:hypothetical protein
MALSSFIVYQILTRRTGMIWPLILQLLLPTFVQLVHYNGVVSTEDLPFSLQGIDFEDPIGRLVVTEMSRSSVVKGFCIVVIICKFSSFAKSRGPSPNLIS